MLKEFNLILLEFNFFKTLLVSFLISSFYPFFFLLLTSFSQLHSFSLTLLVLLVVSCIHLPKLQISFFFCVSCSTAAKIIKREWCQLRELIPILAAREWTPDKAQSFSHINLENSSWTQEKLFYASSRMLLGNIWQVVRGDKQKICEARPRKAKEDNNNWGWASLPRVEQKKQEKVKLKSNSIGNLFVPFSHIYNTEIQSKVRNY